MRWNSHARCLDGPANSSTNASTRTQTQAQRQDKQGIWPFDSSEGRGSDFLSGVNGRKEKHQAYLTKTCSKSVASISNGTILIPSI